MVSPIINLTAPKRPELEFNAKDLIYSKTMVADTLIARCGAILEGTTGKFANELTEEEVFSMAYADGVPLTVHHHVDGMHSTFVTKFPVVIADDSTKPSGFRVIVQTQPTEEPKRETPAPPILPET